MQFVVSLETRIVRIVRGAWERVRQADEVIKFLDGDHLTRRERERGKGSKVGDVGAIQDSRERPKGPTSALLLLYHGPGGVLDGLLDGVADLPAANVAISSSTRASPVESLELLLVSLLIRIDSTLPDLHKGDILPIRFTIVFHREVRKR